MTRPPSRAELVALVRAVAVDPRVPSVHRCPALLLAVRADGVRPDPLPWTTVTAPPAPEETP
jgi:hypothetical protein